MVHAPGQKPVFIKGQNALDPVVYRGGDVVSAWAVQALASVTGITGVGLATAALGAGWWWFSRRLAARGSSTTPGDRG
jgi:ATP/ADP translocase